MAKAKKIKIHDLHLSQGTERDEDGWWRARCSCGYGPAGPFPDAETMVDDLMQHAREMGYMQAKDDASKGGTTTARRDPCTWCLEHKPRKPRSSRKRGSRDAS